MTAESSASQHRQAGQNRLGPPLTAAVLTISDTRTEANDHSGRYLAAQLTAAGCKVSRLIVADDADQIRAALEGWLTQRLSLIVTTGGTGLTGRDVTIPITESLLTKPLPGFGELFRMLSYREVGAAAMLSRAVGGLCGQTLLFSLPGSLNAAQTAWEGLLQPELHHLVYEVARHGQPEEPQC
ncbi:molybdenum cofactor biosynthesis protein B [Deinococcus lacus]|uniref:Molybdenum cofactor biosynthesis protein B n=1 Tax=Deinococcus lacus TaxID=392561 RepID=A0ABW1YCQ1_9DEIO